MRFVGLVLSALTVVFSFTTAVAETIVIAVEDKDWSPYYVWADGQPQGPCPEIAAGAIRLLGDDVEFVRYPWVRVLQSVELMKVDAGLCGTRTEERASYSYYPDEPLLNYDATLFVRANSPIRSPEIAGLKGKSFGLIKGYNFGGVDDDLEAGGMIRIETTGRENLLKMLEIGRVDTVLDSLLPLTADARTMGISKEIRALKPSLAVTPGYLFFSHKPGHKALAERFSDVLKAFKATAEYREIKERYGL